MHALASVDPTLFRALALTPGQRVLDLGCGSGEPTLAIAQMVAPGRVLGTDVAAPMLVIARRRARLRGIHNVRFARLDMSRLAPRGPRFHRVVSRFGVMFANDVAAVLAAVRRRLLPGGRVVFSVWGPVDRNPMFTIFTGAIAPYLKKPPGNPEELPHPMRFARQGRLERLMRDAGFHGIRTDPVHTELVYPTVDHYVGARLDNLHGEMLALFESLSRADQNRLRARLRRGMSRYRAGAVIRCPGFAWVVSAKR